MRRVMGGLLKKVGFCDACSAGCGGKRAAPEKLAPSLRWAQGKIRSAPTGGWIAEEGRVLRRVRNRSVLCTPMRDYLSSFICEKIVKKLIISER